MNATPVYPGCTYKSTNACALAGVTVSWIEEIKSETARLREQVKELHGLVLALLDNDPDDMAADGVTVLDVWRKSARALMEKTNV